jgi:hypothetical protein
VKLAKLVKAEGYCSSGGQSPAEDQGRSAVPASVRRAGQARGRRANRRCGSHCGSLASRGDRLPRSPVQLPIHIHPPPCSDAVNSDSGSDKTHIDLLGRELLRDPFWVLHAAKELKHDIHWPVQYMQLLFVVAGHTRHKPPSTQGIAPSFTVLFDNHYHLLLQDSECVHKCEVCLQLFWVKF